MHRQADFFLAGIIKNRRGHEQITKGDKFSMEYHDDSILHECQVKLNIPREQEYSLRNLQEHSRHFLLWRKESRANATAREHRDGINGALNNAI